MFITQEKGLIYPVCKTAFTMAWSVAFAYRSLLLNRECMQCLGPAEQQACTQGVWTAKWERLGQNVSQDSWRGQTAQQWICLCVFFSPPSTKSFTIAFCAFCTGAISGSRTFDPELGEEKKRKCGVLFVLTAHSDYESGLMRFDYHAAAL